MPDLPTGADHTGPYRMARPTLDEAYRGLLAIYGPHTADIWRTLLFSTGLTGQETSPAALDRLLAVMHTGGPLIQLCARSLQVRISAYDGLARASSAQ
jgi:hypothetical protein